MGSIFVNVIERERAGQVERAPATNNTDASIAAANSMKEAAPMVRERVFNYIRECGANGATSDEAERALGLSHQTCSARFNELVRAGRIDVSLTVTGAHWKRATRSGRKAQVWVVVY